jgi:hypothetical protein
MSKLRISSDLWLPVDAVTQKLAWLGTTGSGKTYGAMKLAEEMWDAGLQFAALDTMGIWYGLRLPATPNGKGIPIVVFGGKHGDIPVGPKDGRTIADVIIREGISAVIDISQFDTDTEKSRFGSDFADALYRGKMAAPSAIHLFLEEAHEFIPQNCQPGEAQMLHHFNRLWKQGRNYGIGCSIITQRPQDVNKKASELSACVFAFNITGSNAFDAVAKWLKGAPVDDLRRFSPGQCLAWSPAWLKFEQVIQIEAKRTLHVSFDPFGKVDLASEQKVLAPVALDALRDSMAKEIEEQSANDPAVLKARIKELEKQVGKPSDSAVATAVQAATTPLVQRIDALETIISESAMISDEMSNCAMIFAQQADRLRNVLVAQEVFNRMAPQSERVELDQPGSLIKEAKREAKENETPAGLAPGAIRILTALATLRALGRQSADRRVVAVLSGQSPKSGSYGQNLAALRRENLIETVADGLALTKEGIAAAPKAGRPSTLDDYHRAWKSHLSTTQARMLDRLIALHPKTVTREQLADLTNQSPKSGSFGQNLARLRSFQLIVGSKDISAADLLFPEGLK